MPDDKKSLEEELKGLGEKPSLLEKLGKLGEEPSSEEELMIEEAFEEETEAPVERRNGVGGDFRTLFKVVAAAAVIAVAALGIPYSINKYNQHVQDEADYQKSLDNFNKETDELNQELDRAIKIMNGEIPIPKNGSEAGKEKAEKPAAVAETVKKDEPLQKKVEEPPETQSKELEKEKSEEPVKVEKPTAVAKTDETSEQKETRAVPASVEYVNPIRDLEQAVRSENLEEARRIADSNNYDVDKLTNKFVGSNVERSLDWESFTSDIEKAVEAKDHRKARFGLALKDYDREVKESTKNTLERDLDSKDIEEVKEYRDTTNLMALLYLLGELEKKSAEETNKKEDNLSPESQKIADRYSTEMRRLLAESEKSEGVYRKEFKQKIYDYNQETLDKIDKTLEQAGEYKKTLQDNQNTEGYQEKLDQVNKLVEQLRKQQKELQNSSDSLEKEIKELEKPTGKN